MSKLTFGAEVHRLVPNLFRAEVTLAEHRLPHIFQILLGAVQDFEDSTVLVWCEFFFVRTAPGFSEINTKTN